MLLACPVTTGQSVQSLPRDTIERHLTNQIAVFPQEKLHLHIDRSYYAPGEKVWFKAYLTNAFAFDAPVHSRYVYAELISPLDSVVARVMIRPEEGLFHGVIPLPDDLVEGSYTLKAYTRYMENQETGISFRKQIGVGSLLSNQIKPHYSFTVEDKKLHLELFYTEGKTKEKIIPKQLQVLSDKKGMRNVRLHRDSTARLSFDFPLSANMKALYFEADNYKHYIPIVLPEDDYDVSFFPEGGNLLAGTPCRMAFKAVNSSGYSEDVSGYVVNESEEVLLTNIQSVHSGMGQIVFFADKGKRYFFVCKNSTGLEKRFELPEALSGAYTLETAWRKNNLLISRKQSADIDYHSPLYLLIHHNGTVCYWGEWGKKTVLTFSKESFPQGILQLLLFDADLNPLSERLVFCNTGSYANISFNTDKPVYDTRDKVSVQLKVNDKEGNPLSGNLSVAITDNHDVTVDSTMHIVSTLLLSSELRGTIENPAYYFQDSPMAELNLDLLMQTHGWRRYNVPQVVKGRYTYPAQPAQETQELKGEVKRLLTSKPVVGGDVSFFISSPIIGGFFNDNTQTDENGRFSFNNIEFPDSLSIFVQSLNRKGNANARLTVEPFHFPPILPTDYLRPVSEENSVAKEVMETYINKAEKRALYDDNMRIVHLQEVEIVAAKKDKAESPYKSIYASAFTAAIDLETIEKRHATRLIDLFYGIAGVQVVGESNLLIRGISSINSSTYARIMIDGMETDSETAFSMINPSDVARIEIFKGADAAIFGVRGGTGVVNIITKTGAEVKNVTQENFNTQVITPLGYQRPVEFYSPKYETPEQRNNFQPDMRATLYWKPDLLANEQGEANVEFYTSDAKSTTYSVVIEGITTGGLLVRDVRQVVVE